LHQEKNQHIEHQKLGSSVRHSVSCASNHQSALHTALLKFWPYGAL